MNILGIETSSSWGSVAVTKDSRIVYASYLDIKITHSERLLPQIDSALRQTNLSVTDLDAIAISNGPGSFTGVRIGLAAAKGLCFAQDIPLLPVNTLKVLAANVFGNHLPVLACMDARMQEVYAALYDPFLNVIIAPCNAKPSEFLKNIHQNVTVVGDGAARYSSLFKDSGIKYFPALPHQNIPSATALVSLILHQKPDFVFDFEAVSNLQPWYLRLSQAEINQLKQNLDT